MSPVRQQPEMPSQNARGVQVVWFKRDLRIHDHRPLVEAAKRGPCVCLFVYEPSIMTAEDFDASHLAFVNDSLRSLASALEGIGAELTLRIGEMPAVLDDLHHDVGVARLWSHQETGNALTYSRDRRVATWASRNRVTWTQIPGHGVVRALASRDGWAARWHAQMSEPLMRPPQRLFTARGLARGEIAAAETLALSGSARMDAQRGGVEPARELLETFLTRRGVDYPREMSSPLTAWSACSRLSPHFAWGTLSIREAFQASRARAAQLGARRDVGGESARWRKSLAAFQQRLRWHCHFIQKLEDEPAIEFRNMNRAYDGLREDEFDAERFVAWGEGRTGYPMVDACMRALHSTGWINFRMRAMLVSFASYHLWLHWRPTALHLARLFLDYEPGIHYSQVQMQSGVTGINSVRIYSPIKQVRDHDPEGLFIRSHVPELAQIPSEYIAEPHTMPVDVQRASGCIIGRDYPPPIVEHRTAYAKARARIAAAKGSPAACEAAREVYRKHGSRRRSMRRSRSAR